MDELEGSETEESSVVESSAAGHSEVESSVAGHSAVEDSALVADSAECDRSWGDRRDDGDGRLRACSGHLESDPEQEHQP